MKSFSFILLAVLAASNVSAQLFNYQAEPSGNAKCALINVVMDESGSMRNDQTFMRDIALPRMARELQTSQYGYNHVFICSTGFTRYNRRTYARELGCSTYDRNGVIQSPSAVAYRLTGGFEDGWHGIKTAIETVPSSIEGVDLVTTCNKIHKNVILVTDEDRDNYDRNLSTEIKNLIQITGYVLNAVVNIRIDGDNRNMGMKIDASRTNSTIFRYDNAGVVAGKDYTTTIRSGLFTNYVSGYGSTHADYSELIVGTTGAIWNINALRRANLASSFADVFVDVKVEEISRQELSPIGPTPTPPTPSSGGDPHITTWKNEHYEYHGQCDLVMMNDPNFADGLGLDIHIRTKIVRHWSYIKNVAIKIGNDILEIEGSADADDAEAHYWYNFEYQGEIDDLNGFPVTQKLPSVYKRQYKIDLSSKFGPGKQITVQIYKEFIRVSFNGDEAVFGNTVGLLGDYKTGKTVSRDGITDMYDYAELGDEWQVLPSEPRLFHEVSHPQFPEACIQPEDPRGERKRRLEESSVSVEQAEKACATLKDPLSIKDCIYDILATQDLEMVGAF
jgi:hypothetical protein